MKPDKIYIQPNAHDRWFEGNKPNDNFVEDIRRIVKIADDLLDDPKARVAFNNHNEEYYYKRVLDEYNKLHKAEAE